MRDRAMVAVLAAVTAVAVPVAARSPLTEFRISVAKSGVIGITVGPDGNVWFTEYLDSKIGRITPAGVVTGEFTVPTAGSRPRDIAAGPDGNLWFTESFGNKIGQITPAGVFVAEYPLPTPKSYPFSIIPGPDGVWFTQQGSSQIGRLRVCSEPRTSSVPARSASCAAAAAAPTRG